MAADHPSSTLAARNLSLCVGASTLAMNFMAKKIGDAGFDKCHSAARSEMGIAPPFEKAGPAARIRLWGKAKAAPETIATFLNKGAQINAHRQAQGSS